MPENISGERFAGNSGVEVGPDGYLYTISIGQGEVFKISNKEPEVPVIYHAILRYV
jgi:hypothetical protein